MLDVYGYPTWDRESLFVKCEAQNGDHIRSAIRTTLHEIRLESVSPLRCISPIFDLHLVLFIQSQPGSE